MLLPIKTKILIHFYRYPCINIVKNLMDAHLYIIKKWVVDYLAENK